MHSASSSAQYLLPPTGRYAIGYRDFSSEEFHFRVYYPSEQKISIRSAYNPKGIKKCQKEISDCKIEHLAKSDIESLNTLTSLAQHNLTPLTQKQPIIYFIPGMEGNAPEYENILCELASHGYMIIGLDNTDNPAKTPQMAYAELKNLDQALRVNLLKDDLFSQIDFKRVGLLGHSMGGVAAILAGQRDDKHFQAVAALDAPADLAEPSTYNIRRPCKIPALQFHASTWIKIYSGGSNSYAGSSAFITGRNGYHIILKSHSDSALYSDHNNFSDRSTLQYHPAITAFNNHPPSREDVREALAAGIIASPMQVGCGNGVEIARTINEYVCGFYQTFVLRVSHNLLASPNGVALPHTHFLSWSKPILVETATHLTLGGIIKSHSDLEKRPLLSELNESNTNRCCCLIL